MPADNERLTAMDMAEANAQCGVKPRMQMRGQCPRCDGTVMIHCETCKIQVTGCICTEIERFGNAEGIQKVLDRYGEEEGIQRLKNAGFWIPKDTSEN